MKSWFAYLKQGLSRKLPRDRISEGDSYAGLLAGLDRLRPFIGRHWHKALLGIALIASAALFSFPQPIITRYIIDDVILSRQMHLLAGAILLLIGVALAAKLTDVLQQFYFARFEQEVTLDLQQDLFEHTLRLPQSFFDEAQTGYLMSRLSADVEELHWFFSSTVVYIISSLLRFLGGAVLLFYLEWRLALVVIILIPAVVWSIRYFSAKIHVLSHQQMEKQARAAGSMQESLAAAGLIKAFASERRAVRRLISRLTAVLQITLEQTAVASIANLAISSMPGIARIVVLSWGAYWIILGQWTLGSLIAFQAYLGYVFGPAQFLAAANLQLQKALAALQRICALYEIVPEANAGTGEEAVKLKGEVAFEDVSFSYDQDHPVLTDITFRVAPGEKIAIVGPSGVGKTTLLSLLLRFYRPTAGEIYFDKQPAAQYDLRSLRQRIGYVSQSTLLLSGTIGDNLRYGNPEAGEEEVLRAARVAGMHEVIERLPAGYDTEIGENGVQLSEGQKQRLAIARALVKNPDILILDEPTSAMDGLTEKSIFSSLPALIRGKTLFVAAHRLSTIREADRIFLLMENRLAAVGTHRFLMETNDYYRSVLAYQQGEGENSGERTMSSED